MGIAVALALLVIPFFIGYYSIDLENAQSLCPVKMASGVPCPGCGITKSIYFFYTGDIYKSIGYHIFGVPFVIFSILAILLLFVEIISGRNYFKKHFFSIKLGYLMAIFLGIYHIYRLYEFFTSHSLDDILIESVWK